MPVALLAHPSFPAKTIGEVVALARKEAGKFNIGTSAVGTGGYLSRRTVQVDPGRRCAIIPYKGTAPLMNDLLGGHVPVAFGVLPPAMGNLAGRHAARHRRLEQAALQPAARRADLDESGLPGFEAVLHYGLLAPHGTPRQIVDKLNAELRKLVATTEVKKRINNEGGDPLTSTPEEYAADIDQEEKKMEQARSSARAEGGIAPVSDAPLVRALPIARQISYCADSKK